MVNELLLQAFQEYLTWLEKHVQRLNIDKFKDYCVRKFEAIQITPSQLTFEQVQEITRSMNRYLDEFTVDQEFVDGAHSQFAKIREVAK